jgi:hypothetical protein
MIHIGVTADGKEVIPETIRGVPRCAEDPGECSTWIEESWAMSIAHDTTFLEGKKKWVAAFKFHPKIPTYVWAIYNTLGCRGDAAYGSILYIDANSGEVYSERHHWTTYHVCGADGEPYPPMMRPPPYCVNSR